MALNLLDRVQVGGKLRVMGGTSSLLHVRFWSGAAASTCVHALVEMLSCRELYTDAVPSLAIIVFRDVLVI